MASKHKLLIVGLGNPGKEYSGNRHNAGFIVLDALCDRLSSSFNSDKKCISAGSDTEHKQLVLLKPQEYMNLSGNCVSSFLAKNGIHTNQMLVIHDEIDIPFGDIRLKFGGGHAGHNGLRNIIDRTGTRDFHRLRFGVGRPPHPDFSVADFVLSNFTQEEKGKLGEMIERSLKEIEKWMHSHH